MTTLAIAILVVVASDPLVVSDRLTGTRPRDRWTGVSAAAAVAVALVWLAQPVLDGLRIEPESFWIASGLVLAATGIVRVAVTGGIRRRDPVDGGGWLVPVAYPIVLGPELVLAALAGGAHGDEVAATVGVAVVAVAVAPPVLEQVGVVLRAATNRLLAAAQVVLAIALVIDGIRGV